jgi:HEPN superfamily RiboL-PSP-like protein
MTLDPLPDDFIPDQMERYNNNLLRVDKLIECSQLLAKDENRSILGDQAEKVASDILRSGVVFIHASLEDFLRSVARILLPYSDKTALDKIPLAGTEGRADKFSLGSLAAHREKSVQDVIKESIKEHLLDSNYGSTNRIDGLLSRLGIKINDGDRKRLYPQLTNLIERRHQIVHRADKSHQDELEPISSGQVQEWIEVVESFMEKVVVAIASARLKGKEH